jgi:hypothetical protein
VRDSPAVLVDPRSLIATAVVLAALAAAAGCGGDEESAAAAPAPPPTLPAAAVPYLESEERTLTAAAVAKETGVPRLSARLAEWGYESGASRHFQGQSKRLQVVDARAYRFRSPAGAAAFMRLIRQEPGAFFPAGGETRAFAVAGRRGIAIEGLPCACHLAQPAYFAAVTDGTTVRSLEINGARASVKALRALVARAP